MQLDKQKLKLIRVFFAIDLPEDLRDDVKRITEILNKGHKDGRIRWSKKENLHLTLCFIGEIPEETTQLLQNTLRKNLSEKKAFTVPLGKIDHFPPHSNRPHAVALHLSVTKELLELVEIIKNTVSSYQLPTENRPYLPHITLARLKTGHEIDLNKWSSHFLNQELPVREIVLYRSNPGENGSDYIPLGKIVLS